MGSSTILAWSASHNCFIKSKENKTMTMNQKKALYTFGSLTEKQRSTVSVHWQSLPPILP